MVSFADKFRKVVAANFVEISRPENGEKDTPKAKEATPVAPSTPPAVVTVPKPATTAPIPAPAVSMSPQNTASAASAPGFVPIQASDNLPAPSAPAVEVNTADVTTESRPEEPQMTPLSTAEPVLKSEAVSVPPKGYVSDPLQLVAADGAVEFEGVFTRAEIPSATSFTAEQALSMLYSMPSDLPLRIKRLTVRATLDAVGKAVGATPDHIVADAGNKISSLEQFLRDVAERAQELRDTGDSEIERLRASITQKEAEKAAITQREESVFVSCRSKIDELDQVVAFFTSSDSEEIPTPQPTMEEDTEELPAYLQEDAVKRLLGLHGGSEEASSTEPDPVGAQVPSSRSRR